MKKMEPVFEGHLKTNATFHLLSAYNIWAYECIPIINILVTQAVWIKNIVEEFNSKRIFISLTSVFGHGLVGAVGLCKRSRIYVWRKHQFQFIIRTSLYTYRQAVSVMFGSSLQDKYIRNTYTKGDVQVFLVCSQVNCGNL